MPQFSWLLVALLIPLFVAVPTLVVILRHFENPRLSPIPPLVLIGSVTLWCLGDAARLAVTSLEAKLALLPIYYLMGTVVVVSLFVFAADYSERTAWRRPRRIALLLAPMLAMNVVEITNVGSLTIRSAQVVERGGVAFAEIVWGPMFYLHHGVAYLIVGAAAYMFLTFETTNRHYRGQVRSIVGALSIPWMLNVAYLIGLTGFNYTTTGFAAALPIGVLMIFRYRILRLIPVARSSVVEEMDTGYLVLDRGDVVVDVNDRAAALLGIPGERLLGYDREFLEATFPEIEAAFDDETGFDTITRERDGERRYYNVEASKLGAEGADVSPAQESSSVVLFQDVTEQIEAQRQLREQRDRLEEQNERLEEFASFLSHDLRNPLSVANGRLELAREEHDSVHMEQIAEAHERMDELIEDALALARQGQTVLDREPVSLRTACESAWNNVDTGDATLSVTTDCTVSADASQLTQLLENLFRNAIEHGGPDVTVTVGDVGASAEADAAASARTDGAARGFFVADDGPGIPEAERDRVFEKGFSTDDDGTGFGLAIVATAAETHGWSVRVTESEAGGARFEILDRNPDDGSGPDSTSDGEPPASAT
ncbi:histidine kinase N-terminal 7TM domain-containing protein [Halorientalis halophila]|uniref:sensor histidine kinase n=1 Tax=Halorientalis halophila TaxID=3108499 RepID=UPI00300BEF98